MQGVTHFELPVDDMERAKKFYNKVFGWIINATPGMGEEYQIATTTPSDEKGMPKEPGVINGGFFQRGERGDRVEIIIAVPSISKATKEIEKAGGKMSVPQMAVGEFGIYAQFIDTEGNKIGLWEDIWQRS